MEKELPKNWVKVFLYDAIEPVKTGVNNYTNEKEYFSTGSVNDNRLVIEGLYNFKERPSRANREVKLGDVLQARMSDTNKAVIVNKEIKNALFSTGFMQFRVYGNTINPRYLFHYVKSDIFLNQKNEFASGTTQVAINDLNAKKITFPLPPLSEQNRIVEKLDRLFGQLEVIKSSMEKIPVLLKNFRQQILTQAVTGKLTEEWRGGKELEEWKEGSIEDFLIKKGIFDGPFGSHLKTEDYLESGNVRVIRLENIDSLKFNDDKSVYVSDEKYTRLIRHEVFEGDIIFSSFISERIRACILPFSSKKMIAKADCFCLRNDKQVLNTEFFSYVLVNPLMFEQLLKEVRGATRPRINTTILKKSQIIVPPIKEQQEIVSRVESLFAKADAIEEKYKNLKTKIETLPQTILHKAFKGELSEQLETDGDAKDLLEEIVTLKSGGKPKKVVAKNYVQPDEVLRIVAEADATEYSTPVEKTAVWYDERFELWVSQQGLAARGSLDKDTLRELFDAMDDEDK